jgi:hypothetical protein
VFDPVLYGNGFQPRVVKTALHGGLQYCLIHTDDRLRDDTCGGCCVCGGGGVRYLTAIGTSDGPKTLGLSSSERLNCVIL